MKTRGRAFAGGPPGAAVPGTVAVAGKPRDLGEPGRSVPGELGRLLAQGRLKAASAMLGPAFVTSVAYVDPGNFATNIQAGARYGYLLLWMVLAANVIAMLVQYLAAKLGVITGRNLPELLAERCPRAVTWALWAQAEVIAMATDVAEFIGAALGLQLLFGVPPLAAGIVTCAIAFGLLGLERAGYRRFEAAITALLAIVFAGFLYETLRIGPSARGSLRGLVPSLGGGSLYLAVGILGATVMPHVIYLHSALLSDRIACRDDRERGRVLRWERTDVIVALGLAGLVNMAMLAVAARLFHAPGLAGVSTLTQAHAELGRLAGGAAAAAFAVALLAAGVSSASVGTYAGQVIMAGFLRLRVPVPVRRAITMMPALAVLATGVNPTSALLLSQVVLSFGIPFALVPLVLLTCRRDVMGAHANRPLTTALAWSAAALISGLNVFLVIGCLVPG